MKSECTPKGLKGSLNYVDSVTGWFHLQMQILVLLYRTHLGESRDLCSLEHWITVLERNRNRLWDAQKDCVKNYRACEDLFETVLDGYIVGALTKSRGYTDTAEFLSSATKDKQPELLSDAIKALATHLASMNLPAMLQGKPKEERDRALESMTLFMQHGLTMRNFKMAMRDGDSGRALASLSYYTLWFHGSSHRKYAMETMHLTACLKEYWSPAYVQFYMDNCLINPSGRAGAFMADDFFGEWMIAQAKARIPHNYTSATDHYLRNTISPQLMFFREVRLKMTAETEATTFGYHSTAVKKVIDVTVVCDAVLDADVCTFQAGRALADSETMDLFAQGLVVLGSADRLEKYKKQMVKDFHLNRKQYVYCEGDGSGSGYEHEIDCDRNRDRDRDGDRDRDSDRDSASNSDRDKDSNSNSARDTEGERDASDSEDDGDDVMELDGIGLGDSDDEQSEVEQDYDDDDDDDDAEEEESGNF